MAAMDARRVLVVLGFVAVAVVAVGGPVGGFGFMAAVACWVAAWLVGRRERQGMT